MPSSTLTTRFTQRLSTPPPTLPILLAPMGGCAGGLLAAAISTSGGIGLIGSGGESLPHLRREWSIATSPQTPHRRDRLGFGLNIAQLHSDFPAGTLHTLLREYRPAHVYLSFGDTSPYANTVRDGGAVLYANASDCHTALAHARAGVHCIVVQGSDAGGHTSPSSSTLSALPQLRDALDREGFSDTLLLAAGGVCDGRNVAACLLAGADAVVLGTALTVATESLYTAKQKRAVVETECGVAGTTLGTFIDAVRGIERHSSGLPGRCLVNRTTRMEEEWEGGGEGVRAAVRERNRAGVEREGEGGEWGATWAGTGCGLVKEIRPAGEIVRGIVEDAVRVLEGAGSFLHRPCDGDGGCEGDTPLLIPPLRWEEVATTFVDSLPPLPADARRLYLLRHGRTAYNVRGLVQGGGYDIPLDEQGLRQARLASAALSSVPLDVVASSHLERALRTAEILRDGQGRGRVVGSRVERAVLPGLGEMRFGKYEGMAIHGVESNVETRERFLEMNEKIGDDENLKWPGGEGESVQDVRLRARAAVEGVMGRYSDARHVALVGHGRLSRILMGELLFGGGGSEEELGKEEWKRRNVAQGNTAINVLDYDVGSGRWTEVVVNYTRHIEEKFGHDAGVGSSKAD